MGGVECGFGGMHDTLTFTLVVKPSLSLIPSLHNLILNANSEKSYLKNQIHTLSLILTPAHTVNLNSLSLAHVARHPY